MNRDIEILCIGKELLIGKTLNTNAQWLARRLTSLGLQVSRITTVGDDVTKIAETTQEALARTPYAIITTGGLGPTFDDKTLEGIGEALGSKLEVNHQALQMVRDKYLKYAEDTGQQEFELTPARTKMAKIPREAEPLPNPIGTAPAVSIRDKSTTIFVLPGVPSEMKAIFSNSLIPFFTSQLEKMSFFETSLYVTGVMESEMAPLIDDVMSDNPTIYIKSHPKGSEEKPRIELHLSTRTENLEEAKKQVDRALDQLTKTVKAKGGKVRTERLKNHQHS